jgi:hypothetical protein
MSRNVDADMLYARRLQELEREQLQQRLDSQRQDAELARRLSQQFEAPPSQPSSNQDDSLLIQMGQKVTYVKLIDRYGINFMIAGQRPLAQPFDW